MKPLFSCCSGPNSLSDGKLDAKISQAEIKLTYDRLARVYDIWGTLTESRARRRAIELAEIKDGQNILEAAVGTGLAFYEIVKRNPHGQNFGIDLSEGMLEKAKKRLHKLPGARYSLVLGTALDLPVAAESIDLLINNYLFDLLSFEDMDRVLAEFKRVLKKGGRLILINMTKGETAASKVYDFLYRLSPKMMGGCRGVRLADKLTKHGFTVETREYVQQMLFPSEVIVAHT